MSIESNSIAQRMRWASRRKTSRPEDVAYCLLGIFSVNMPMLYGEGERAFRRLQEEIIKASDDHSIFAWRLPDSETRDSVMCGLLAEHPRCFCDSPAVEVAWVTDLFTTNGSRAFAITNKGLQMEGHFLKVQSEPETYAMALNCRPSEKAQRQLSEGALAILIDGRDLVRVNPSQFVFIRCLPFSTRKIWAERTGTWPVYDEEYLPREPVGSRYSIPSEKVFQDLELQWKPPQSIHDWPPAFPMLLSNSRQGGETEWAPIAWSPS